MSAEKPDFPSLLLAHDSRHVGRAEPPVEAAHFGPRLTEACVLRGTRQVANQVEHVAPTNGVARYQGDHGFGNKANQLLQIQDIESGYAVAADVTLVPAHTLIPPGTEGFVAFAGQEHHANFGHVAHPGEGIDQFLGGLGSKSVVFFGSTNGHPGDAIAAFLEANVLVFVDRLPIDTAHIAPLLCPVQTGSRLGG